MEKEEFITHCVQLAKHSRLKAELESRAEELRRREGGRKQAYELWKSMFDVEPDGYRDDEEFVGVIFGALYFASARTYFRVYSQCPKCQSADLIDRGYLYAGENAQQTLGTLFEAELPMHYFCVHPEQTETKPTQTVVSGVHAQLLDVLVEFIRNVNAQE